MNNLFWKDPHRSQNGGVSRRTVLLSIVICALGVFLALRFGDDLSRKIVTDRDTVNHARVLTEADLVAKLDELLGSLSLHRKLAALDRQLANGSSVVEPDVEKASKEILAQLSSRLNRQYHVFRSTMDQLPKHTDLFTHFLPQYDDIQERFCADLEQLEAPLRSITRGASTGVPLLEHDLILETLSRYQLVVSQVSSRASLALERTIAVGADQLLFFIQIVIIGLAVLISVFLILVMQGRDRARVQESAAEAYESLVGVMEFMDPSWAIDISGTVIYWNRAVERLTGIPADEMIGKSNHEYALPFYGERRKVLIDLVLEWDEEIQKKYMFIDTLEDGSFRYSQSHQNDPLGAAVALEVINLFKEHELISRASSLGETFLERLQELTKSDHVSDVRGRGMMFAVEFRDKTVGDRIYERLLKEGYIVCNRGGMFRIDPPLIIEDVDFFRFTDVFSSLLDDL